MNKCVAPELRGQFSLIFDGGSLEHIYDVPQCIKNIVSMLEVSGHLISINGANNFMGHGFYQFSPEFFFRVFSSENGFSVDELVLSEVNRDATWYSATDPAMARQRVELVNNYPTYIMVRALKRKPVDALSVTPQQSDYELKMWSEGSMHLKGNTVGRSQDWTLQTIDPANCSALSSSGDRHSSRSLQQDLPKAARFDWRRS